MKRIAKRHRRPKASRHKVSSADIDFGGLAIFTWTLTAHSRLLNYFRQLYLLDYSDCADEQDVITQATTANMWNVSYWLDGRYALADLSEDERLIARAINTGCVWFNVRLGQFVSRSDLSRFSVVKMILQGKFHIAETIANSIATAAEDERRRLAAVPPEKETRCLTIRGNVIPPAVPVNGVLPREVLEAKARSTQSSDFIVGRSLDTSRKTDCQEADSSSSPSRSAEALSSQGRPELEMSVKGLNEMKASSSYVVTPKEQGTPRSPATPASKAFDQPTSTVASNRPIKAGDRVRLKQSVPVELPPLPDEGAIVMSVTPAPHEALLDVRIPELDCDDYCVPVEWLTLCD
jgi:hypothetical protein